MMAAPIGRSIASVSVGVDRPGVLDNLGGAASSAADFHNWLLEQEDLGVEVDATLLTDSDGAVVTHNNVTEAVNKIVKKRACDCLFLYFSGHGVTSGGYDEKFLLSNVDDYPNDVVNIRLSILDARYCGIAHVVLIYDACRSPATGDKLSRLGGSSVVKRMVNSGRPVDVFFGCGPDESSYEIPRTNQSFFTQLLLESLRNPDAKLLKQTSISKQRVSVIPSANLEVRLKSEVPDRASKMTPPFDQSPDIETPSHLPEFFAVAPSFHFTIPPASYAIANYYSLDGPPPVRAVRKPKSVGTSDLVSVCAEQVFHPAAKAFKLPKTLQQIQDTSGFGEASAAMSKARGRDGFETHTGFTVIGASVAGVKVSGNNKVERFREPATPDATQIRVGTGPWDARPGTALIKLQDGGGVALAMMPGYVGTVVINNGRIDALAYAPSHGSVPYAGYKQFEKRLQSRRGLAAAAASISKLHQLATMERIALAHEIRVDKGYDPMLGILAAYAYYLADDQKNVADVLKWMSITWVNPYDVKHEMLAPVPFDVAMLAGKTNADVKPGIAPFCPMFSFGWSLLERSAMMVSPAVLEAGKYRRHGIWTAFDPQGMMYLEKAFEEGSKRENRLRTRKSAGRKVQKLKK